MAENTAAIRAQMADQTRQRFRTEICQLSPAEAANLTAVIDTTTSLEAHEVMAAAHARTNRQITKAWVYTLQALLDPWLTDQTEALT